MKPSHPALRVVAPMGSEKAPFEPGRLDTVFRYHASYVAAVAFKLLGRDDEVDDVVQEVFLAATQGLRQLREPEAIKGWLATVTVRVARRHLRKRKFLSFFGASEKPAPAELISSDASPHDRALLSRIFSVLEELPVQARIAWTLRHVEGERLEAVARLCGCSLATAKRRIAAAHEVIERLLSDG
ncbi:MAG: RNA polymerase sigma factor [Myxococcota bacterium]